MILYAYHINGGALLPYLAKGKNMNFVVKAATSAVLVLSLGACSFAPVVAQKLGIGTAKEDDIIQATAKVFGVDPSLVKVSQIQKEDGFNGTQIFYAATVQGKAYRCGMLSSFAGSSLPKCVKPGTPLSLQ